MPIQHRPVVPTARGTAPVPQPIIYVHVMDDVNNFFVSFPFVIFMLWLRSGD